MSKASETAVFTVRVPGTLRQRLDAVAAAMERPRTWVVNRALEEFVEREAWQIAEIERAVAEADAGDFASDEEVAAAFDTLTGEG